MGFSCNEQRYTDAYSSAVCTGTVYSTLTVQYSTVCSFILYCTSTTGSTYSTVDVLYKLH